MRRSEAPIGEVSTIGPAAGRWMPPRMGWCHGGSVLAQTGCDTSDRGTSDPGEQDTSIPDARPEDQERSTGDDDPAPNEQAVERLTAATGALVDRWGDQGAFYASMAALHAGYSTTQLVDAAVTGALRADGSVDGVEPERPPAGLLGEVVASRSTRPAQPPVVAISTSTVGVVLAAATQVTDLRFRLS